MQWRKIGAGIATTITVGAGGVYGADVRQNPYEDKGTHYELPIKSDIPQGERVEIAKDRAAMTLKGWNDEYAITVIPQIPGVSFGAGEKIDRSFTTHADRPLLSKKMEYRSGNVTAFIEPKEGTENEFDIDFTLDAKPETNVFEYRIEGAEEFDFFYQPPLTEEAQEGETCTETQCTDTEGGVTQERPENVVGSYAVYHKTKANHRVGSTNYAAGKAFHIYRPKAVDANGEEVWAQLHYSEGVLSVTVPQKFLENAPYPVVVDPTFGHTSAGSSNMGSAPGANDMGATTDAGAALTDAPENGTLVSIHVHSVNNGNDGVARGLVYNQDSSGALVDYGPEAEWVGATGGPVDGGWSTLPLGGASIVAGTAYHLGYMVPAIGQGPRYDTASNINWQYTNTDPYHSTNPPPSPFSPNFTITNRRTTIYATYTAAAPPAAAPSDDGVVWFE